MARAIILARRRTLGLCSAQFQWRWAIAASGRGASRRQSGQTTRVRPSFMARVPSGETVTQQSAPPRGCPARGTNGRDQPRRTPVSVEHAAPGDRDAHRRTPHLPAGSRLTHRATPGPAVRRGGGDFEEFWARSRANGSAGPAVRHHARMGPAVPAGSSGPAERRLQLRRPARRERARQQGRLPLDRRAGRHPHDHLRRPPREVQKAANALGARHREGRPRRDLHADDPRAADRDARLRADRRPAHGRLRRILSRGPRRAYQRRRREGRHHRRRRLAARQPGQPEA